MDGRVGIYPGTFNPIHEGHVSFAREAIKCCRLDKVLIVPDRVSAKKSDVPDFYARLEYAKKFVQDVPKLELLEVQCVPQTMEAVQQEFPALFEQNTIVLLIGSDILKHLLTWEGANDFLRHTQLCIGLREADTAGSVEATMKNMQTSLGYEIKYTIIETDHQHVSSTTIRSHPKYQSL